MARFCLDLVVSLAPPALEGLPAMREEQLRPVIAHAAHSGKPSSGIAWTPAKAAFFLTAFTGLSQTIALRPAAESRARQRDLLTDVILVAGSWEQQPDLREVWEEVMQELAHAILPCEWARSWRTQFTRAVEDLLALSDIDSHYRQLVNELAGWLPGIKRLVPLEKAAAYKSSKQHRLARQGNFIAETYFRQPLISLQQRAGELHSKQLRSSKILGLVWSELR